ncbi:Cytochrome c oxidase assembly protein cox11, mitochondrial [Purpureocillium takamizusanense]|uniref:Cytochrome c oxidase assembly protein cox11, mitochondrial n=1 Tax=Purpureocillium takamizusanense TaxID=2060973 RepID=A0A9Q8QA52_9HYPO|nr:Cytochrome c oxidase assembly protein cox11, mitochondrial [Purpureocillium takamizusanense]UNI15299.1 Cytochrome c oxidase assembly protein cox11, mitochondrial [Purpureocillium takamizusanense]
MSVSRNISSYLHCSSSASPARTLPLFESLFPIMSPATEIPAAKRVAVVGSGCSGIAAVWALKNTVHDVYLYEADARLGGHSNTVQWQNGKYSVGVDTGFIVLNTATYPNFIRFLKLLNVATEVTDMALGVSRDYGAFEWGGKSLRSVFCQAKNLFSIRMWRMLFDVLRFNQFALDVLINSKEESQSESEDDPGNDESIGAYLDRHGYSHAFRDGYLIPITASVWSTKPKTCMDEFPVLTLIRFLWNHHNLSALSSRPEWLTLKNGSRAYIDAVMDDFPTDHVFLNTPVKRVENHNGHISLYTTNDEPQIFDHVILATHGDQALSILGSAATDEERSILSCFKTSKNEVVLHSDLTHMPQRRGAWCSWNYMTLSPRSESSTDVVSLTYNMNTLQHIPKDQFGHVLVTLNPLHEPTPALTQGRFDYSHPIYTSKAVAAQRRLQKIQNKRGISFAGAWTNYGFHEDGFSSGLRVARDHLGATLPFEIIDSSFSRGKIPHLSIIDYAIRVFITLIQSLVIQPLETIADIVSQLSWTHKDARDGRRDVSKAAM